MFLIMLHRYLEVMLFSRTIKNCTVFTLIIGGRHADLSKVLVMFREVLVFPRCVFYRFLITFEWKHNVHRWSPGAQNRGNTYEKIIIHVFLVFVIS